MTSWILLLPALACFVTGAWVSYSDRAKAGGWFLPAYLAVSVVAALVWVAAVRRLPDKPAVYVYSLVWDGLMVCAYYVLPAALFVDVGSLKPAVLAGIGLMLLGLCVVKLGGG